MPGGGKIRFYKERRDLYTKYLSMISTLKMVTLARYRQALPRANTRDYAMKFARKAFDVPGELPYDPVARQEGEEVCAGGSGGRKFWGRPREKLLVTALCACVWNSCMCAMLLCSVFVSLEDPDCSLHHQPWQLRCPQLEHGPLLGEAR